MTERSITISGQPRTVVVGGADGAPGVLILAGEAHGAPVPRIAPLTERLEASGLQSFVWDTGSPAPTHEEVASALDQLGLHWVNLVGTGDAAPAAWETAARHFGRVSSLVVLDGGHPAVADADGAVLDQGCPAVDVATTLVLTTAEARAQAYASGRHVYSDFRVVEPAGGGAQLRGAAQSGDAAQWGEALAAGLATEIILRSNPW
ncbi:alpha/beta hydrolase [Tomitella gaofuii]|uniref:alpha/beta hydrolase n=1 Tax=Tomitella gaofuii TaxID=2760083 RepID=UPI0015F7E7EC|nr:alpha/beta hydrolase [Tomitella gaofuii]